GGTGTVGLPPEPAAPPLAVVPPGDVPPLDVVVPPELDVPALDETVPPDDAPAEDDAPPDETSGEFPVPVPRSPPLDGTPPDDAPPPSERAELGPSGSTPCAQLATTRTPRSEVRRTTMRLTRESEPGATGRNECVAIIALRPKSYTSARDEPSWRPGFS